MTELTTWGASDRSDEFPIPSWQLSGTLVLLENQLSEGAKTVMEADTLSGGGPR
jgi:hypothetical protein